MTEQTKSNLSDLAILVMVLLCAVGFIARCLGI